MVFRHFMKIILLLALGLCIFGREKTTAQSSGVIPQPADFEAKEGYFTFATPLIGHSGPLLAEAQYLQKALQNYYQKDYTLTTTKRSGTGITLLIEPELPHEGYVLEIGKTYIHITGGSKTGVFYGIQTLLQYCTNKEQIRCCNIKDTPRFAWRGLMLDESRHFFGKEKVKQLLEQMAFFKLNKFHWHLTDEPGWRIEIKKHPELTTVGGQGNWSNPDGKESQYYTQEEIREIITYAASLHIEVIPEIDMPGHATAANKAYPHLSGGGTAEHPDFTFNVGKEETYRFLTEVLREVASLFPAPYLHIGGDEVAFGIKAWETNPDIQTLMQREGMTKVREAEQYFIRRMSDSVHHLGKTVLGWDELLDSHLPTENTVIMWWRHDRINQLKKSLSEGYATILCPRRPLYFDFIQHQSHKWGRTWNGFCPSEDVYAFPDSGLDRWDIPEQQLNLIRGIQANVWTERIQNTHRLDFMIFPRICALAEAAWTPDHKKNYADFRNRLEKMYPLWDQKEIYYFDTRETERHSEPTGPQQQKRNLPMNFRD